MFSTLAWGESFAHDLLLVVKWEEEFLKLFSKTQDMYVSFGKLSCTDYYRHKLKHVINTLLKVHVN